jgi:chromosome segregation protein
MPYLKKIDIFGFKSFPSRIEIFFQKGSNVIIGPNGSGKSNILDALVWGIGETKISSLRGGKTEDIIFSGNRKKKPLAAAEVSLVFDNDGEEIRLFRKAYRDGESVFRVNSKRARLKDIVEELYKLGIGDRKYFFIEQGMIGNIITMGPLEKRILIEEAAGISRYREKKKEAFHKLFETENNLNILNNVLEEVSSELIVWEREFEKLKTFKRIKKEYRDIRKKIYFLKLKHLESERDNLLKIIKNLWEEIEDRKNQQKIIEDELNKKHSEHWELQKTIKEKEDIFYKLREKLEILKNQFKANNKRISDIKENLTKNKNWISQGEKLIVELENREKEIKREKERDSEELEILENKKTIIEEKKTIIENRQQEEEMKLKKIQDDYIESISRKTEQYNKLINFENMIKSFDAGLKRIIDKEEELKREIESLKEKRGNLKAMKIADYKEEIGILKDKVLKTEKKLNAIIKKHREKELEVEKLLALKKDYNERLDEILSKRKLGIGNNLKIKKELSEPLAIFIESLLELSPYDENSKINKETSYILKQPTVSNKYDEFIKSDFIEYFPPFKYADTLKSAIEEWKKERNNYITKDGVFISFNGEIIKGEKKGVILLKEKISGIEEILEKEEKILNTLTEQREREKTISEKLKRELDEIIEKQKGEEDKKQKIENEIKLLNTKLDSIDTQLTTIKKEKENNKKQILTLKREKSKLEELYNITLKQLEAIESGKNRIEDSLSDIKGEKTEILDEERIINNNYNDKEKTIVLLEKEEENIIERVHNEKGRIEQYQKEISELEKQEQILNKETKDLEKEIIAEEKTVKSKNDELSELLTKESDIKFELENLEKALKKGQRKIINLSNKKNEKEIEKASHDRDIINLEDNLWKEMTITLEELVKTEIDEEETMIIRREEELSTKIEELSEVRLEAENEYMKFKDRFDFYNKQKEDIQKSIDNTREIIAKIDKESRSRFLTTLEKINENFKNIYKTLFKGGSAEIKLIDETDILNSGVEIKVKLPGKKLQNLQLLSGGEKALSSLAFIFSMFLYKPSPICVLDEVDAPLDEANIENLMVLINEMKANTQFLIVTHNPKTLEVADTIYGVTMIEPGVSSIYSIDVSEKEKKIV